MELWEYCVVYGGWQQETWVYFLRDDEPSGYIAEHHTPDEQSTFKRVASLGKQGWEAFNVQPKFGGATDGTKCTFSHNIWFLRRRTHSEQSTVNGSMNTSR